MHSAEQIEIQTFDLSPLRSRVVPTHGDPMDLIDYVLAFLLSAVPPSHHANVEPESVTIERYGSIAEDIAMVASDPNVEPLYSGRDGRAKTAIVLASVAVSESMLRGDVDRCEVTGDGGKSVSLFQLQRASKAVCSDRQEAARVALERVRASLMQCRKAPASERLAAYVSGRCDRAVGESRRRLEKVTKWLRRYPVLDAPNTEMQ